MNKRKLVKKAIKQAVRFNKMESALIVTVCVLGGFIAKKISSLKKEASLTSVVDSGLNTSEDGEDKDK